MANPIFLDTIKGIKRERPPVWFMRQAGRVLPSYMKMRESYSFSELMLEPELAAKVTLLPVDDLGVDAAILFSDILVVPQAMGMRVDFTDKGPKFAVSLKDVDKPFESLQPDTDFFNYIYDAIKIINETKKGDTPLIGFCGAPLTVLCYMVQGLSSNHEFPDAVKFIFEKPEEAKKIVDLIVDISIIYAQNQIESGIQAFQLFETHAGLIPVKLYKELFLPAVKKIGDAVRKTGTPFIYFPKGIGNGIIEMNTEIADFISIDWQMDISKVRQQLGNEIGLQGNFDQRFLLTNPKVLKFQLEKYIEFGSKETKWIFNLGHGVLPNTPFENAKFAIDWIKSADWKRD
ncbi:MAG: uroporphyrinogen decarboxylase [Bacteroidetes bacterium GWA2_31_9]|nr:MAG: uroporphyrinogen decarboxylase [Bacteroidetes bacterium GWA2_31_9]